ncbi:UNVERIFIED_CONTAM: hypothetical protein ABIC26_002267 [Paenibacillus sp. PvR008]
MSEITGTTLILFLLAKGLSLQSANFLLVVYFVSIFLFEIPTGAIADKRIIEAREIAGFWGRYLTY